MLAERSGNFTTRRYSPSSQCSAPTPFTALVAHLWAALPRRTSRLPGQADPIQPARDAARSSACLQASCEGRGPCSAAQPLPTPVPTPPCCQHSHTLSAHSRGQGGLQQPRAPAEQPPRRMDLPVLPGTALLRAATGAAFIISKANTKQTTASACLSHYRAALRTSQAHFDSA